MPIQEEPLNDWDALAKAAQTFDVGNSLYRTYIYRGQEDASWSLTPSLHRAATNDGRRPLPGAEVLLEQENMLWLGFRDRASALLPPAVLSHGKDFLGWLPLMRHYGVPTRVLDWTASFYVAAYFAAAKAPDADGAIFVVHGHSLAAKMKGRYGDESKIPTKVGAEKGLLVADAPPVVYMYERSLLLDRMAVQQGVFMVCRNIAADIEEALAGVVEPRAPDTGIVQLLKFRIPAALKPTIMRRLRAMNVQAGSLFPGPDGIGRQLDELIRNP